jgi:hypothetical protein
MSHIDFALDAAGKVVQRGTLATTRAEFDMYFREG